MPPHHEDEGIERLRDEMYSRQYADKLGPRPRRSFDGVEPPVAEDWARPKEAPEAPLPPLAMLVRAARKPAYPVLKWMLAAAAVFFAGAVAFFVYYLYFGGASAISDRNIDIAITGPAEIAGGEPADLEVTVTNRNSEPLQLADLVATFPGGTRLDPASCGETSCRVSLGTIASGATDAVKLPAVYEGASGQQATVSIVLEYRLGNSNAIFTAQSQYGFTFSSSPISLSIAANSETISGQPMQLTLTVSSGASSPVPGVLVSVSYPFGFKETSASPEKDAQGLWELGTLNPGDQKTITVNGVLTGVTGESKVFHFAAGTAGATSTAIAEQIADLEVPVTVAAPFLQLGISVNDASSSKAVVVTPGQLVTVAVDYKNNLPVEIDNAVVVAKISGLQIDGTTVHSGDGFYRSTDNAVLWDKTTTGGELATLASGAEGQLTFSFQAPPSSELQGAQNPSFVISVDASGQRVGQTGVPENLQSTAQQKVAIASSLSIASQGLYFTNPFGVTGNMPPQAGVETSYAAVLTITNTTNAIQGAKVTATLPLYVRLVGNHYLPASEKVDFNGDTGVFTWNVGDIAPGTGVGSMPARQVVIELGFTPSTSQIGTSPPLLQNITLAGTDALTGAQVTRSASDITTNIAGDPGFTSANAKVVAPSAAASSSSPGP